MTWGYDSVVTNLSGGAANQNNIFAHAKTLLYALDRERRDNVKMLSINQDVFRLTFTG